MNIQTSRLTLRPIQRGDEIILEEMSRDRSFSKLGLDSDCAEWIGEWIEEASGTHLHTNEIIVKLPRRYYNSFMISIKK
ncbi:hypothetical protein SAMN04487760_10485 [Lachnospiraceae bacterium G41]|nr:hypothetical protein SAMN04487760_10485 [Lachnospiraceae bacterium G41]